MDRRLDFYVQPFGARVLHQMATTATLWPSPPSMGPMFWVATAGGSERVVQRSENLATTWFLLEVEEPVAAQNAAMRPTHPNVRRWITSMAGSSGGRSTATATSGRSGSPDCISNLGAFGSRVVEIGMTRRLDPTDRIRELVGASVRFPFDVHALYFSDAAVALEAQLHAEFAHRRLDQVTLRREFFLQHSTSTRADLGPRE
ncbi:MAG: GIY-YIG nuclease family protein [Nocardioides sp.]